MILKPLSAVERRPLDEVIAHFPEKRRHAATVLDRLKAVTAIPPSAAILDVGAAAGEMVAALNQLGYRGRGVEPWAEARENAVKFALHLGIPIEIVAGTAEHLPFADAEFDVVLANSVMEHVENIEGALAEAFRVLKPGGVFWFYAASTMCPWQHEIRGFPLFGWYPDGMKRRIMRWAAARRPQLVGHSEHPAIHWFTPWKARRLLRQSGFSRVFDRWDLRKAVARGAGGAFFRAAIGVGPVKWMLDVCVPECAYAAVK
jgi:SAM-dependent methyltransferase